MPGGRPTLYNEELAEYICKTIATDTRTLKEICASDDRFPSERSIHQWRHDIVQFSRMYEKAKIAQVSLLAESIIENSRGRKHYYDGEGNERVDTGEVAARKLEIDTIKWYASKLAPKIYGDKQQVEVLAEDNDALKKELANLRKELDEKNKKEY